MSPSFSGRTRYTDKKFPTYLLVSSHGNCSSHSRRLCSQVAFSRRKRCKCGTSALPRFLFKVHALKYARVNFAFRSGSSPHLLGTGAFAKCGHRGRKRRRKYQPCCNSPPALLSKKTFFSPVSVSLRRKSTPGSKRTLASSAFAAANLASPFCNLGPKNHPRFRCNLAA